MLDKMVYLWVYFILDADEHVDVDEHVWTYLLYFSETNVLKTKCESFGEDECKHSILNC